jgi:hypothetical protein
MKYLLLILPLILLMAGCYPDKIDYVDEYDIAATRYDESADFSSYNTFSVIDTIIHLTEDGKDDPNLDRQHDDFIIGKLRDNMLEMGYIEIENPDSLNRPDLLLLTEALSSDYYQYVYYYYDYWAWYPGWDWWYPGYPGYPWYPSYPWYPGYINSYSTGTMIVEMFDTDAFDPEDRTLGVVWTGLIDGLLTGSSSNTRQRLETQINQLFVQSEYLKQ